MRNYWLTILALTLVISLSDRAFSQQEFPPTVDELGVSLIIDQTSYIPSKSLQFEDCISPFFKTYTFLESIDSVILDALDFVVEPDAGLEMPDTATPYRTHGGVI